MKEYIEKNQPIFYNLIKNEFSQQRIPHAFLLIGKSYLHPVFYLLITAKRIIFSMVNKIGRKEKNFIQSLQYRKM